MSKKTVHSSKPEHMNSEVYRKVVADWAVPEHLKEELFNICSNCICELEHEDASDVKEGSVEFSFNAFVDGNEKQGISSSLRSGEYLVRVQSLSGTAEFLQGVISQDKNDIIQKFKWLGGIGGPTQSQIDDAEDWFNDLCVFKDSTASWLAVSSPVCWMARTSENGQNGLELLSDGAECLPCRLGLPIFLSWAPDYPRGLEFLGFAVIAEEIANAHQPTFCDGDYSSVREVWEPGGKTKPVPGGPEECVRMGGVEEIVCDPPRYFELSSNPLVFEN